MPNVHDVAHIHNHHATALASPPPSPTYPPVMSTISDALYHRLYQHGIISQPHCKQCIAAHKHQLHQLQQHHAINDRVPSKRNEHVLPPPIQPAQPPPCTHGSKNTVIYVFDDSVRDAYIRDQQHQQQNGDNQSTDNNDDLEFRKQIDQLIHRITSHGHITTQTIESHLTHIALPRMTLTAVDDTLTTAFKNLQWLDLSHGCLTALPATITNLTHLTHLNISHNKLTDVSVLANSRLTHLNAAYNSVTDATALPATLTDLDLSYNNITALSPTLMALQSLTGLHTLALQFNPVCLHKLYRHLTTNRLTQLRTLDNTAVEAITDAQLATLFASLEPVVPDKGKAGKAADKPASKPAAASKLSKKQQEKFEEQARLVEQQQLELLQKRRSTWSSYIASQTGIHEPVNISVELTGMTHLPVPAYMDKPAAQPLKSPKAAKVKNAQPTTDHTVVTVNDNVKTSVTTRTLFYIQYILADADTVHETPQMLYTDTLQYTQSHQFTVPTCTLRTVLLLTGLTLILKQCTTTTTVVDTTVPAEPSAQPAPGLTAPADKLSKRKSGKALPAAPNTITTSQPTSATHVDILGTYVMHAKEAIDALRESGSLLMCVEIKQHAVFANADNTEKSQSPECDIKLVLNDGAVPTLEQLQQSEAQYMSPDVESVTDKLDGVQLTDITPAPIAVG